MYAGKWAQALICLIFIMIPVLAPAGEENAVSAPPELSAWKGWVLYGSERELCPSLAGNQSAKKCAWPSYLSISVEPSGGSFSQEWLMFAPGWAILPGNAENWPQSVTVDGKPAPVVGRKEGCGVHLSKGSHKVAGRFVWKALPEIIKVPPESGLVRLAINGREVANPVLDADGNLWVERRSAGKKEEDSLSVRVYRLVQDTVPLRIVTRLLMEVGGSAREIALPGAVLPGAVPMLIESSLPARIAPGGQLSVQARPGRFTVIVTTFYKTPMKAIGPAECPFGAEIWSFSPQNDLRMVKVSGLATVDPGLAETPADWKLFPAYVVNKGQSMNFEELRRGDPSPGKNRLDLKRDLWLDFSGRGYTVHDEVSGIMNRGWFLAMNPPFGLGRITLKSPGAEDESNGPAGSGTDLLITSQTARKIPGVELRRGKLALAADSRLEEAGARMSAVGWDNDFNSVRTTLYLPPGWTLFAALGPDHVSDSWLSDWNLFDFFIVLLTVIAAFRLMGGRVAALLLLFLTISHTENGAPLFIWLFLFAALALLTVLPQGGWRRFAENWRKLALIILALISFVFIKDQLLYGFYPHLKPAWRQPGMPGLITDLVGCGRSNVAYESARVRSHAPMAPPEPADENVRYAEMQKSAASSAMLRGKGEAASKKPYWDDRQKAQDLLKEPEAVIQTGPGLPAWNFGSIYLSWTGTVEKGQSLRLFLCPPWLFRVLCFLRAIILVALLAFFMAGGGLIDRIRRFAAKGQRPQDQDSGLSDANGASSGPGPAVTASVLVVFFAAAFFAGQHGALAAEPPETLAEVQQVQQEQALQAQEPASMPPDLAGPEKWPSGGILAEYGKRLLKASDCQPDCVACAAMELTVTPDTLRLLLEMHAADSVAAPLPGGVKSWMCQEVFVDGKPAQGLSKDKDGVLWLYLSPGVHRVALAGGIADKNAITIPLPVKPHRASFSAGGWEVFGILENGTVGASIDLARIKKAGDKADSTQENKLPAFLEVERVFSLSRVWTVMTTIRRVSPTGTAVVALVPLLPGESVTQAGVPVEKGKAVVTLDPEVFEVFFQSALPMGPKIKLTAAVNSPWTETWIFNAAPIWHVEFSGIPVIRQQDRGVWQPMWKPWPGESLTATVSKPAPVAGKVLTVDMAGLDWTAGERLSRAGLTISVRSSQGGQYPVILPEKADLEKLSVNGVDQPVRISGGKVMVALQPGAQQVELEWTSPKDLGIVYRTGKVVLGSEAVNAEVSVTPPANRWILWTMGPSLGPAVLFYRYLALVFILALVLGHLPGTPLGTRQWILLGLGLTQTSPVLALAVVAWFVALKLRGQKQAPDQSPSSFNFGQVFLVALTLVALAGLFDATLSGLLGIPDMAVAGNGSGMNSLCWTMDRIGGAMPRPGVIWLPMWIFRLLMLAWALWLAFSLVGWLKWGWGRFSKGGLWMKHVRRPRPGDAYMKKIMGAGSSKAGPQETPEEPVKPGEGGEGGGA